jgi:hypothetical protein
MNRRVAFIAFAAGIAVGVVGAWLLGLAALPGRYTFKTDGLVTTRHDTATGEIVAYGVASDGTAFRRDISRSAEQNR